MDLGPHGQTEHAAVIRTPLLGLVEEGAVNVADGGRTPGCGGEFDELIESPADTRVESRAEYDTGRGFARDHVVRGVVSVGRQPDHGSGQHDGFAHERKVVPGTPSQGAKAERVFRFEKGLVRDQFRGDRTVDDVGNITKDVDRARTAPQGVKNERARLRFARLAAPGGGSGRPESAHRLVHLGVRRDQAGESRHLDDGSAERLETGQSEGGSGCRRRLLHHDEEAHASAAQVRKSGAIENGRHAKFDWRQHALRFLRAKTVEPAGEFRHPDPAGIFQADLHRCKVRFKVSTLKPASRR